MGDNLTPELNRKLRDAGCRFERHGKGDHEVWYSPRTQRRFVLGNQLRSRHTANAVLK